MIAVLSTLAQKQHLLVEAAQACVGKKFHYGASPEQAPQVFDCSSLIQYLYHQIGITLPRSAILQAHEGDQVKVTALAVGDLLFFRGTVGHYNLEFPSGIGHVAMYLGNNEVIQAVGNTGQVVVTPLQIIKKRPDLLIIKRLLQSRRQHLQQKAQHALKKITEQLS